MSRWLLLCVVIAGCATAGTSPDADPSVVPDAAVGSPDADTSGPDADTCIPTTEECDGDDDDCDDVVDNGCSCSPNGSTQMCFSADPGFIGMGVCVQGTQTCVDGAWSATCAGEVTPTTETCDTFDNDCDGTPDDNNPGGGACSTGMSGVCAAGTRTCTGGVLSGCVQDMGPGLEICDGLDNDCSTGTLDGAAETWFNDPCDGGDVDSCNEGIYACNGVTQACSDATGDSNAQLLVNPSFDAAPMGTGWVQTPFDPLYPLIDTLPTTVQTGNYTAPYGVWMGGFLSATDSMYQERVITAGTQALTLNGYRWIGTEETTTTLANDTVRLEIRNSAGAILATLATWSNLNSTTAWASFSFSLGTTYAGQTIRIHLASTTNATLNTNFFFETFTLNGMVCP